MKLSVHLPIFSHLLENDEGKKERKKVFVWDRE